MDDEDEQAVTVEDGVEGRALGGGVKSLPSFFACAVGAGCALAGKEKERPGPYAVRACPLMRGLL